MPRSLADGKVKFTILTTAPAIPSAPTAAELNAGIDASCNILSSDFQWSAAASDTNNEKALCVEGNANVPGASNYTGSMSPFRYFDTLTGAPEADEDDVFQAAKVKGTEFWGYARETSKKSTEDWAADDEIYLGGRVVTDSPQAQATRTGYTKYTVPLLFQEGWQFIEVGPVVGG
ncbi:hypothetical protein [Occultella kanbiaonis]|uniref:phage tail tube protein n=1 Tax=Occultella kanbiaonis TaxID=2675754 RepID=UPI0013D124ED|nr:hypothetical protein [Occultella kanbiaonis]